ncbi:putative transmembrane protein [Poecilia reticulata]|uniref:putative transmembrane protein n=1 Tax=Poecilia reticulata TaxID=8081 RepID=UPI0007EA033E|nr:PREDICTED: putative transmembrane protein [Poecilia reticulata]
MMLQTRTAVFWSDRLRVRHSASRQPAVRTGAAGPNMEEGKCTGFFIGLAIFLDVVGLLLLLIGIFAPLPYWDFFVLSGPLLIFLSLVLWIFWYLGNLTVSEEELNLRKPDIL